MGNFCERCLGRLDKRRYLRTRYNVERDISIEFENLMDEDAQEAEAPKGQLEFDRPFTISSYMRWLVHQEEELRREEEAYYQAAREEAAARSEKAQKRKEQLVRLAATHKDPNAWLGDNESDWEMMAGGEDEFDMFMECVKARSLAAQTRVANSQVPLDAASETSSKDDRSKTEASSIDLEWEHEAGMQPLPRQKRRRFPRDPSPRGRDPSLTPRGHDLAELTVRPMIDLATDTPTMVPAAAAASNADDTDCLSDDLEWDNDFTVSPNHDESRTLLARPIDMDGASGPLPPGSTGLCER